MKSTRRFVHVLLVSWGGLILSLCTGATAWAVPPQQSPQDTPYLQLERSYSLKGLGVGLDVAVSPEGDVYLSGASRPGLWRLDLGKGIFSPLTEIGSNATTGSVRLFPTALEVDGQGRIWAADIILHQLRVLSKHGQSLVTHASPDLQLDAPVALNRLGGDGMAAWDKNTGLLWYFVQDSITAKQLDAAPQCLAVGPTTAYCVQENSRDLMRYQSGEITARFSLDEDAYARIGEIGLGPGRDLYLTDAAGGRFLSLTADLNPKNRFLLYEPLFQTPTRFTFHGDNLWLIDEGREELLHFTLRGASTGLDHALLGEEYLVLGRFEAALEEFDKALQLGYEQAEIHLLRGKALYGLKRYPEALQAFTSARALGMISEFWRGNTLFRLGHYREALQAFQAASGLDEDLARFNQAQTLLALNEFSDAETVLSRLLQRWPDDPRVRLGLARALIGQRAYADAIALLTDLAAHEKMGRQARFYLGFAYLEAGASEKAWPLLERAASEGPYFRDSFRTLALASRRLGHAELAKQYEKRAETFGQQTEWMDAYLLEDTP